ncbi:MAG: hypothetical protein RIG63_11915 [Coleofasciculus chthonoplastes F3-SA18-01]|uniref:hypothetical protein n=1 Tax=Coleofasciculus chthonoplastes TaxID=64178 RepID=UPI0032F10BD7
MDKELAGILLPVPPSSSTPLPPSYQKIADQIIATWSKYLATSDHPIVQLIFSTQERQPQHQRPMITLDVGQLSHAEQRDIWKSHLGSLTTELNGQIDTLVSQFNLNVAAIQAACLSLNSTDYTPTPPDEQPDNEPNNKEPAKTASSSTRRRSSKTQKSQPRIENPLSPLQTHLWDFCKTQARPRLDDLAHFSKRDTDK